MDQFNLAVVELDSSSSARWVVFTIRGKEVVGIDSSCGSFGEIVKKYGPIPATPLPREKEEAKTLARAGGCH